MKLNCWSTPTASAVHFPPPPLITNEREQVIKLFSQYPDSGLGIPTGPSNGITVIDVDIKNGIDGWFNLRALEIDIPLTGLVRTPSGGFHLYFDTHCVCKLKGLYRTETVLLLLLSR